MGGQNWPVLEHTDPTKPNRTRVVVLGSGWGAISMVKALNSKIRYVVLGRSSSGCTAANLSTGILTLSVRCSEDYDVSLISPRNYFLVRPNHDDLHMVAHEGSWEYGLLYSVLTLYCRLAVYSFAPGSSYRHN